MELHPAQEHPEPGLKKNRNFKVELFSVFTHLLLSFVLIMLSFELNTRASSNTSTRTERERERRGMVEKMFYYY